MGKQRNFLVKNQSEENNGSLKMEFGLIFLLGGGDELFHSKGEKN